MRIRIAKPTRETPIRRSFKTSSKITFFDLSFSAIDINRFSLAVNNKPDYYQNQWKHNAAKWIRFEHLERHSWVCEPCI